MSNLRTFRLGALVEQNNLCSIVDYIIIVLLVLDTVVDSFR